MLVRWVVEVVRPTKYVFRQLIKEHGDNMFLSLILIPIFKLYST